MKTDTHLPPVLMRLAANGPVPPVGGNHVFAPLSVPAISERRIDLAAAATTLGPRRFRFKREDEAVN